MKAAIFYGSYREARLGDRAAKLITNILKRDGHEITFIDAKEENLSILDKRLSDYTPGSEPENLIRIANTIKHAESLIFICGEYNYTIQPGLTNIIDHFYMEFQHKVAGIVSYSTGRIAGVRSGAHLRNCLNGIGMITIPNMLSIGDIQNAIDEHGVAQDHSLDKLSLKFITQLQWYSTAIENHKTITPLAS